MAGELPALQWSVMWGKSLWQSPPQPSKLELKQIYRCFSPTFAGCAGREQGQAIAHAGQRCWLFQRFSNYLLGCGQGGM